MTDKFVFVLTVSKGNLIFSVIIPKKAYYKRSESFEAKNSSEIEFKPESLNVLSIP